MLLSIIVPTYNVENYLQNCLNSLLAQDLDSDQYEIVVVNDGSTDKSGAIADEYASKECRIRVIHQANAGIGGARNTGIDHAKGKYIYFIDSDDYIAHNTLGFVIRQMEQNELDLLGLGTTETEKMDLIESSNLSSLNKYGLKVLDGISYVAQNYYYNMSWWYLIRKDFLVNTALRFPIGRLVEDANFTAKILLASRRVAYLPLDFHRYVIRPNSIMRSKQLDHTRRLVNDYSKNVLEFYDQIETLKKTTHPDINPCLIRLQSRMESFVFFGLIKSLRFGLDWKHFQAMLTDFQRIGVYPMRHFISEDFSGITYRTLVIMLNSGFGLRLVQRFMYFLNR